MITNEIRSMMKADCDACCGLCCVAFYCAETDGFPQDKPAGIACVNLENSFKCKIHARLNEQNMRGCISFDCMGAGNKAAALYVGKSWDDASANKQEYFQVFYTLLQLQQSTWYLLEAHEVTKHIRIKEEIEGLIQVYQSITEGDIFNVLAFDLKDYRMKANKILKKVSNDYLLLHHKRHQQKKNSIGKDMRKLDLNFMDFTMAYIMAANFEKCNLDGANFLGADMRDANLKGANLENSLFLTQMQINSCIGDKTTILPIHIQKPSHWKNN